MKKNLLKNNKGVTLVELLAVIVITSIIMVAVYAILGQGLKTYTNIVQENALREEADVIMAQLIRDLYTTKKSDIKKVTVDDAKHYSYLEFTDGTKTGFTDKGLLIRGKTYQVNNADIAINKEKSSLVAADNQATNYIINLNLTLVGKEKNVDFKNEMTIIDDTKDAVEEKKGGK